jgi:hypothetical protein
LTTRACSSCRVLIDFAVTATGSRMPVDHDSAGKPEGTLAVRRDPESGQLQCRVLAKDEDPGPGEIRGTSHYVTCPEPDRYRREARPPWGQNRLPPEDGK